MKALLLGSVLLVLLATSRSPRAPGPAFASGIAGVAAGGYHTCAITTEGGVRCWGWNEYGQLGDGTSGDGDVTTLNDNYRVLPVEVIGLGGRAVALAGGVGHTCALLESGGVKCWGHNSRGQLGDGRTCGDICPTPVEVAGLSSGVVAVATGGNHTCAITGEGGAKCWGWNADGQLGDGSTQDSAVPVDVSGLTSDVAAIAAGNLHTCAVTTAGAVKCWGLNLNGQLGAPTTEMCQYLCSTVPVDVTGLTSGAAAVAAGLAHTCALTTAGAVMCWGNNVSGQLGDGTTTNRPAPVGVSGLESGVIALTAGGWDAPHTCALLAAGAVECWGANQDGELGVPTTDPCFCSTTPLEVGGLGASGAAGVTAGAFHTCALLASSGADCWGRNAHGEVGDGSTTQRSTPVEVRGLKPVAGDVNCDGGVSAIDAALLLQFSAGLIGQLACSQGADISGDGRTDAVDAAVILQYVAGLIHGFPA